MDVEIDNYCDKYLELHLYQDITFLDSIEDHHDQKCLSNHTL